MVIISRVYALYCSKLFLVGGIYSYSMHHSGWRCQTRLVSHRNHIFRTCVCTCGWRFHDKLDKQSSRIVVILVTRTLALWRFNKYITTFVVLAALQIFVGILHRFYEQVTLTIANVLFRSARSLLLCVLLDIVPGLWVLYLCLYPEHRANTCLSFLSSSREQLFYGHTQSGCVAALLLLRGRWNVSVSLYAKCTQNVIWPLNVI